MHLNQKWKHLNEGFIILLIISVEGNS